MEIIIHPLLTWLDDNTLSDLVNDVSREFEGIRVIIASSAKTVLLSPL